MAGVNKVIVVGKLGANPEVKNISPEQTVARLSVATDESWNDRQGNKQQRTEWHKIVVWGKLADLCGKYLSKGRQVYVEGKLQTRSWEDDQGTKKYTTEIVANTVQFLGGSPEDSKTSSKGFADNFGPAPKFDSAEELPF